MNLVFLVSDLLVKKRGICKCLKDIHLVYIYFLQPKCGSVSVIMVCGAYSRFI